MIEGYKGRTVSIGDKVKVYRNLNNGKWSILAMAGEFKGKVVAHFDNLCLSEVSFKISEAGRARVLREKRKNVHAYAIGSIVSVGQAELCDDSQFVTYDPYKFGFFYKSEDESVSLSSTALINFIPGKAFI